MFIYTVKYSHFFFNDKNIFLFYLYIVNRELTHKSIT